MTNIYTRAATPEDLLDVVTLGQKMHGESVFRHFNFSVPKFATLVYTCITNPDSHFIHVAVSPTKEIIGAFMGSVSEHYFGNDMVASDYLWYVTPKYRGSRAGVCLIRGFQKWAADHHAVEVHVGISTGITGERTGALLKKLGFDLVGGNYKLRVVL